MKSSLYNVETDQSNSLAINPLVSFSLSSIPNRYSNDNHSGGTNKQFLVKNGRLVSQSSLSQVRSSSNQPVNQQRHDYYINMNSEHKTKASSNTLKRNSAEERPAQNSQEMISINCSSYFSQFDKNLESHKQLAQSNQLQTTEN